MSTACPLPAFQVEHDRRETDRFQAAIPATVLFGGVSYSARLLNIGQGGAKIEAPAPLELHSTLELRVGTVAARGVVVWLGSNCIGIKFAAPLTSRQIAEQVSRSLALAAWHARASTSIKPSSA